ncbi:flagellar assembly protein FliH [Bacillus sp. FJAT-49711]|uniref:flagellar assembly protein FliH n=1 Tax=Bacillus sp. FJAT-49711 TaxID=2833585 RepID=UPI001BCA3CFF|nr:flagellar assembly protein FliH [Bacillus sp. FJAT-49711]MBS4217752.1 flagellar assembly protein FliH [Bacillus sp. FJAT-49711]
MSRLIKQVSQPLSQNDSKVIKVRNIQVLDQEDEGPLNKSLLFAERDEIIRIAEIEAQKLLDGAKAEANQILEQVEIRRSEWEQEEQRLIHEAYEKGMQMGIEEGRHNGLTEYNSLIKKAKTIVDSSKEAFQNHLDSSETTIVEIAIQSAERIIHTSLIDEQERFLPLVKRVLKEAKDFKEVQIHVHPLQYELLISEKNELDAIFPHGIQCFIYPDEDLEEYSCYIESENGRIDATISSQLVELKKNLLELLKEDD